MQNETLIDRFKYWLKHPYSDNMSVGGWFLFLGLLAVLSWLWSRVVKTIIVAGS